MNICGYLPESGDNRFSIHHTSWTTKRPKSTSFLTINGQNGWKFRCFKGCAAQR